MNHARHETVLGTLALLVLSTCSADRNGLNLIDAGGSGGAGSGGLPGSGGSMGTGGATGTGGAIGSGGSGSGGRGTGGNATGGRVGSGGAGTGGTATGGRVGGGGVGSGGSATGGRVGSGGAGGSPSLKPECVIASDCKLISDCCTCEAQPLTAPDPPACALVCIQSKCGAQQLPPGGLACVAGRCVAGFNCDASGVTCGVPTPACAAGEVPAINPAGTCFAGGCVPASQCKSVTDCGSCTGSNQACVSSEGLGGNPNHCVTIPAQCGGAATCECLGPTACAPFLTCSDASTFNGIYCFCPNC